MSFRKVFPASSPSCSSDQAYSSTLTKSDSSVTSYSHYKNIDVIRLITKAKFPVYLAFSAFKNKYYALKIFNFEDDQPHSLFYNEVRFAFLSHKNIIKIVYAEDKVPVPSKNHENKISCILMEYAPYGDMFDFVKKVRHGFSEKLARTYFRQLIEGIDYLHRHNVYHLDLKLENILIGEDYQLKITDFDLSSLKGDRYFLTKGTKFYRAPELQDENPKIDASCDIYAAGIILFVMKCGGVLPHSENELFKGVNFLDLMNNNKEEFFYKHCIVQGREASFFDQDFKELFLSMVRPNPRERATIKDIKNSKWYKGAVYSTTELKKKANQLLSQ